ncbi:MAG: RidA family protein [Candidatus Eiseniibacteriota bacterium]
MTKIHNPAALGSPPTYSNGIEVPSTARTLYIAGQVGWDKDYKAVPGGIVEQTRAAFANLHAVLKSAGMDYGNIVKTTVFLVNPDDFPAFGKTRSEILGAVKPASTLVFIKQLIKPELLVEVEAVAVAD